MASKWLITVFAATVLVATTYAADSRPGDDWRVYINSSCIVSDEPFLLPELDDEATARLVPLFGFIATKLAGTLVHTVIESIDRGGSARKDTRYATASDFNLYMADLRDSPAAVVAPRLGCFTVVAGEFDADSNDCTSEYLPREVSQESLQQPKSEWQTTRSDSSIENVLRRANVCMIGEAKAVYEARIVFSDDKTAYRMINAGYWINSLWSTKSSKAKRNLLYTLEFVEPSGDSVGRVLSTAWVNVGQVSAGDTAADDAAASRSDWLRVPPISVSARRAHQSDTAVHQDVIAHIEALERAVVRDARSLAGIRMRAETANPEVRRVLDQEMARIGVKIVTTEAMLDARYAEYEDLPRPALAYMPTMMRFGITEIRSEKKAMQFLAAILDANSDKLVQTASEMVAFNRSLDPDSAQVDMESLRQRYFDALVAVDTGTSDSNGNDEELNRELAVARQLYNAARISEGMSSID